MKMYRLILPALALCVGMAAPASAAALARACASKPSALPKARCVCYEHQLQKVLTPDEMRIQILAFRGKFSEFRKKAHAMNSSKAKSFMKRVNSVVHGKVCNH